MNSKKIEEATKAMCFVLLKLESAIFFAISTLLKHNIFLLVLEDHISYLLNQQLLKLRVM